MKFLGHSTIHFNEIEASTLQNAVRSTTVGIDCHKSSYHVNYLHRDQKRYCKFGVGATDMYNMTLFLRANEKEIAPIELVLLESTGPYSRPLFLHLSKTWPVCMINPSEFTKYGKKTDKFDAEKLATLAMQGLFQPSFLETPEEIDCKQAARAAKKHRQQASVMSNSLGAFLVQNNIGITRGLADIGVASKSGMEILQTIVSGESDPLTIAKSAGYYTKEGRTERFEAIVDALEGARNLSGNARSVIAAKMTAVTQARVAYTCQMEQLRKMVGMLTYDGLTGERAIELLKTIPSISERAALFILSETGLRITKRYGLPQDGGAEEFVSYCGLNPSRQYSGDKQTSTRKAVMGNCHIREILIECGQSLMKSLHQLGERYRALQRRNGGNGNAAAYKIAVAAAAKGLCKACYWVLVKRVEFSDDKYDYTQAIRHKELRLKKLMKDIQQVQQELKQEGNTSSSVLKQAIASLAKEKYVLEPIVLPWDTLFEKRIKTTLEKANIRSIADVWYYLSSDTLKNQVGIGEKTYQKIIDTLKTQRVIQEVA